MPTSTSKPRNPFSLLLLLLIAILTTLTLILSFVYARSYTILHDQLGTWGCRMSWMNPGWVEMKVDRPGLASVGGVRGVGGKYGVYLYREGGLQVDIKPQGKPILFIPGNAGSYKQIRSIGSSAAHLYDQSRRQGREVKGKGRRGTEVEWDEMDEVGSAGWDDLDFFAVDFHEEFSALHPGSIRDQAEYVSHVIPWIKSLYPSRSDDGLEGEAEVEVVIVGHSMGGVVARLAVKLMLDRLRTGAGTAERGTMGVKGIITMSTPHALPPLSLDRGMERVYDEIEGFWQGGLGVPGQGTGGRPVLISICGGTADTQIVSDGCALPRYGFSGRHGGREDEQEREDEGTFSVFTTGMDGIWTGVDHQAMVWCDQVRTRVARLLLGMQGNSRAKGGLEQGERERMVRIARRELLGDVSGRLKGGPGGRIELESQYRVERIDKDRPMIRGKGGRRMISCPLVPAAAAVESKGCTVELLGEFRVRGVGPVGKAPLEVYVPVDRGGRTWVPADLSGIEILPPSAPFVEGDVQARAFPLPGEGVRSDEGLTYVTLNIVGDVMVDMHEDAWAVVGMSGMGQDTGWKSIRKSWWFDRLDHALLAQRLTLHQRHKTGCSNNFAPIVRHRTLPNSRLGETHEARYHPRATGSILLHSHTAGSPFISASEDNGITVEVFQDPRDVCRIENASLQVDWSATPGLSVLRYRTVLAAWAMGWLAIIWAKQMRTFRKTGVYPAFQIAFTDVLAHEAFFWAVAILVAGCLQAGPLGSLVGRPEHYLLGNTALALVVFVIPGLILTLGSVWITHLGVVLAVWMWSNTVAKFTANSKPIKEDGKLILKRRIAALACLFIILWTLMPYQFAFVIIFLIHFSTTAGTRSEEQYHQYHSLFLTMLWLLPLNAPTVLVWARGIALDWRHALRFGSKWGLFQVVGFTLLGEGCAGGMVYARRRTSLSYLAETGLGILAAYSFLCGPRFTYGIEIIANALACYLVVQMYQPVQRV